tara:strand:- start:1794 stop:2993 length:1200 start_codon:yes stop_codon:yes gene_type:complete
MTELVMFAYPWDILEQGVESFFDEMAALGVNRISVATCYHSADLIVPNRLKNVATSAEANVAHLPLNDDIFSDLSIPKGSLVKNYPSLFPEIHQAARKHGIGLTAWTIAFHNSDLAKKNPDTAIENCFGDKFSHGLCATNPKSQEYAKQMVNAICQTNFFDTVMVESLSFLLYGHGHPHELWAARLDPFTRVLLSLCFCESCLKEGKIKNIDGVQLKARVARELNRTWNSNVSIERGEDDGKELASRLVHDHEFTEWIRMRCNVVNKLASEITTIVHNYGFEFEISAAVWGRPSSMNWAEGVDIKASAQIADRFVLESYYPEISEVARELDHVSSLAQGEKLMFVQTLWPEHNNSIDTLIKKIEMARAMGIKWIGLYNYSMATKPLLSWVEAVSRKLKD